VDSAVLFGTNLPATWMTTTAGVSQSIADGITAAGHGLVLGAGGADAYDQLLGVGGAFSFVEGDGFMVNGTVMHPSAMAWLRGLRADSGAGLPVFSATANGDYSIQGVPTMVLRNGAMVSTVPLIVGDWNQVAYAVRQDIEFKLLTEGVIQDAEGAIVYNLAQQDMVALRVVFRLGVQIANPVTNLNTVEATRYPFAAIADLASS
jgi:hypothetical protein